MSESELRNSPSLNLDEIVFDTQRKRPESLSEDEWRMIQSIYVPGKPQNQPRSPPVIDFKPISIDVNSISPNRRHPISPNLNETRKIFQPDPDSRPTEKPRIFGQFSPPPRRRLQPNRFYSPTRQIYSPPALWDDLRSANQRELAEKQALENSSISPTRQFSVVPPNRSLSPSRPNYTQLRCVYQFDNKSRIYSPKLPSPRLLKKPNSNGYEASDEMTPIQTFKKQTVVVTSPIRAPTKPPLPNNVMSKADSSAMQHSFYDNVDMDQEKQQQKKFVSRFGLPQRNIVAKFDETTPPPSDPEQPRQMGSRKESSDSILSNTSRESVFSMTSLKNEIKLRRNFNY